MKTKNNVQKTILRSGAVIISFVLISFTVSAQEFWRKLLTNSSFNEIAIAMVDNVEKNENPVELETETDFYFFIEEETEEDLQLEEWMTNEATFGISEFQIQQETETELELQEWMLDNDFFYQFQDGEQPLNLEAWMTSEELWNS